MLIEDSAHAIFTIVIASITSNTAAKKIRARLESELVPWCDARTKSHIPPNVASKRSGDPSLIQLMRSRKAINPFAAEFLAQGVLSRLGIPTVAGKICSADEARELSSDFVVKVAGVRPALDLTWSSADVIKSIRSGWCFASRIVASAATFDYVARSIIPNQSARTQVLRKCAQIDAAKDREQYEFIAKTLGKSCPAADRFFVDFVPMPWEIERIRSAMALDGPRYLRICAARVFLGCSAPHFGNVLVTTSGQLISIDHARAYFEDGEDLRKLFDFVDRDSKAFTTLAGVAALTEEDICASVSEIPTHPACSSTAGLADYYVGRLRLWKDLFAGRDHGLSAELRVDEGAVLACA